LKTFSREKIKSCDRRYVVHSQNVIQQIDVMLRDPKKCTGRDWGMGSSTI